MKNFDSLAASWWQLNGPSRLLHRMNSTRVMFIQQAIHNRPMHKVLDIGCGGGIFTETAARIPGVKHVDGVDVSESVLEVARAHASIDKAVHSKVSYLKGPIEDVTSLTKESYDVVSLFEVLEHVDSPSKLIEEAMTYTKPGGSIVLSTINRTVLSYLTTIFMAEKILKLVPDGVHSWSKYINYGEIKEFVDKKPGWNMSLAKGSMYVPTQGWILNNCPSEGNYFMALER
ncbi:hypothetical protein CANCADRAFT_11345, partial [Tortispora caseinolytica NRRL Y-17796]